MVLLNYLWDSSVTLSRLSKVDVPLTASTYSCCRLCLRVLIACPRAARSGCTRGPRCADHSAVLWILANNLAGHIIYFKKLTHIFITQKRLLIASNT